ncbi:ABC transporter permease [Larkinella terrae]|uniref:FtsX-like permease family protein n=1 Tax=Larkinella terrae TaxID=2025311 RepID=A0A7K0ES34_9BACT|nr:ABC transporter permease [Larkinella terrae]MRS64341.1 FtsX-like permease family protein [Larkinella terrae]
MIQNYVKIAWRNLLKYKLFSFINILGLGLAIPSVLMGLIQIVNYYEYDNFHEDDDRIVRVITDEKQKDGSVINWASSPVPLGTYVREKFVGIDNATTIVRDFDWVLSNGLKTKNSHALYTDKSFFQVFKFPLEKGIYPLEPNTIVLTQETAQWFFKDSNPIGKSLEHSTYGSFRIVGVLKPFNQQKTQFRTDVMVSFASYLTRNNKPNDWSTLHAHTFLKLSKETTTDHLDKLLANTSVHINTLLKTSENKNLQFKAQFLSEISPAKEILENDPYVQDVRSISLNFAFQLIIILLASLNYINLTLARSMNRSREVGVRKVAGATKAQLVLQFLVDSVLISYLALGIGLFLLWVIKNQIHVSWLTWDIDHWGYLLLIFFGFNLILGLIAGAFPSLILSSFQPVKVLKGAISPASFGKIGFRKSLIIGQFTIALVYIFFMGHAFHQINYMANDNENYHRQDILNINLAGHQNKPLATDLSAIKEVQKIGYTSLTFGNMPTRSGIKKVKDEAENLAYYYAADHNFIENMGLNVVSGTNLIASDSEAPSPMIVVNQKAVEKLRLGSEQEAIGKLILLNDTVSATIIGVVANFCHYDYERKIEPMVFQYQPALFKVMCLKTSPVSDRKLVESTINELWNKHNPHQEMNASWLDTDMYERYYPYEDMRFSGMEGIVILVIAILGLIGILTYSLEKRTKEIGIRKVIGATAFEIVKLMSNDFIKLLAIATIISIPLGIAVAVFMNSFFIFNNGIGYLPMSLLLSVIIGVALGAVGYFSWKAAQTNPARTLKAE